MKKYIKMNKNNYLSLGNVFNTIKKYATNKESAMQVELFCALFNISNINNTTVNNYCIGYRPIGIEYKKIYYNLLEQYKTNKFVFIPIILNILNILDEHIYNNDNYSLELINNNKKIKQVVKELIDISKNDNNIDETFIKVNEKLYKNNNIYELFINLINYSILENKQPIYIEDFNIDINEEELKDYLRINLYSGISYISSLLELSKKNNRYACAELGSLEFSGLINGTPNYESSYNYYLTAANKNHPKASWMVANLIFTKRVKNSEKVMLNYLNKAIELGSIAALNTKGLYLLDKDEQEALKYFEEASKYNYVYAFNNLGLYYEKKEDYSKALEYFKISADLNQSWALNKVGEYYRNNKDLEQAYFYYNKSIECPVNERNYYSYYNLAKYFYQFTNKEKAIKYLEIANNNNIKEAKELLNKLTKE